MPSSSSIPASEPSQKVCPTTEACWSTRRSGAESESRRAASTAWTVSGSVWTSFDPSSRIRLTISSANRGLPRRALGDLGHELAWPFARCRSRREQGGDQLARLVLGQRLERDRGRVAPPAAPTGAAVEQLVARQADDQGGAAHPARQVLDQVEHALVGPVDVLDRDHHRVLPAHAPRPASAPRRTVGRASAARRPRRGRRWPSRARPAARCRAGGRSSRRFVPAARRSPRRRRPTRPRAGASPRPARNRRCRRARTGSRRISPSAQ